MAKQLSPVGKGARVVNSVRVVTIDGIVDGYYDVVGFTHQWYGEGSKLYRWGHHQRHLVLVGILDHVGDHFPLFLAMRVD